ncbi:hypothetical protein A2230_01770 [candidate division WOR-1 bacterium RIFOXYA2_FULL_36_21]|nr:MAG: hypothetical protein A2230_01770 [candidate division WOR-1 bacterium RIFOXYA2_FULL_36_21]OGC16092.1 MAG: hypothetical protein A2282_05450 [candidate division WOR-1 bacterium RIFOXYA12_FULL_36_13]
MYLTQSYKASYSSELYNPHLQRYLLRAAQLRTHGDSSGSSLSTRTLIESNLLLVVSIAHEHHLSTGYPLDDLIQEGNIGLFNAAQTFIPSKDTKFSTYAANGITKAIRTKLKALRKYQREVSEDEIPRPPYHHITPEKLISERLHFYLRLGNLSSEEAEIIKLTLQGYDTPEIGAKLGVSKAAAGQKRTKALLKLKIIDAKRLPAKLLLDDVFIEKLFEYKDDHYLILKHDSYESIRLAKSLIEDEDSLYTMLCILDTNHAQQVKRQKIKLRQAA